MDTSEIARAVPPEELSEIPDNTSKVLSSTLDPALQQPGHIPIAAGAIDSTLREIPQKPYTKGCGEEKYASLQIPYFPSGFTASTVASGDTSEVVDADGAVPRLDESRPYPEKTALHVEFCNSAYAAVKPSHTGQRRVAPTRGAFATFAAQEIQKIIGALPNFPYTLNQIKVLSIDVRSRGTVQPRLFVDGFVMASQQPDDSLGQGVEEVVAANLYK